MFTIRRFYSRTNIEEELPVADGKSVLASQVLTTTVQVHCGCILAEEVLQTIQVLVVLFAVLSPRSLRIPTFKLNERIWIFRSKVKVACHDFFHQPGPSSGPTTGVLFTDHSIHQSFISTTRTFTVAAGCKRV